MEENSLVKREKAIIGTSVVGIGGNVLLVVGKIIVGVFAHSISIITDAVNNLTDALSSIVTIIGTKISNKRPDKKTPVRTRQGGVSHVRDYRDDNLHRRCARNL